MLIGLLLAVSLRAAHELVGAGVLPALVRDLGGESWAGAFFAVYGLACAAGILVAGRATDVRGPVGPLAVGLALFAVGMTATGLAPSMAAVVAARALEGFGGGMMSAVVSAVVMRAWDEAARPRVLAWLSAAWVVPGLVAPALAVAVADAFGWRVVFLGLAPVVGLAAVLVLPALRKRSGTASAAPARAVAGGEQAGAAPHGPPWPGAAPGSPRGVLVAALAVRALIVFAFFGVESFLPLSLSTVRGASPSVVAAVLTISALAWTAGAFLQSRACARWSAPALASGGVLALLAGLACATAALFESTPLGVALSGWTLAGLGMGFAYNTATASAMSATYAGAEGATGAALGITDAVASSLSTAIGGVLLAVAPLARGAAPVFVVAAFVLAAAVGAASLAPARRLGAHGT